MNADAEGRQAADEFRRQHHLGLQPLGDLVALIEQTTGFDVAVLEAPPDEHGLTMRDPSSGKVFIGVARTDRPMRQRSTLAHELGHVLFQDWSNRRTGEWSDRDPAEIRADAFARHLLVPVEGLKDWLSTRNSVTESTLSEIVQRFLVSPSLASIALSQLGCINDNTKQEWMSLSAPRLAARFGWSDHYNALQYESNKVRAPQRLLARAIRGYAEGVLSAQAVATLRGVPKEIAEADLRAAGIEPRAKSTTWTDPSTLPKVDVDLSELKRDLEVPDIASDHDADGHT